MSSCSLRDCEVQLSRLARERDAQPLGVGVELPQCQFFGRPRREPGVDLQVVLVVHRFAGGGEGNGHPQLFTAGRVVELGRHHADDVVGAAVERELASDRPRDRCLTCRVQRRWLSTTTCSRPGRLSSFVKTRPCTAGRLNTSRYPAVTLPPITRSVSPASDRLKLENCSAATALNAPTGSIPSTKLPAETLLSSLCMYSGTPTPVDPAVGRAAAGARRTVRR